jgi:competence protein ComEA
MDLIGEERGRLARVASWFDASPAEITGLAVLLVCAVAATVALVWAALGRPDLPTPAPGAEVAAGTGGAAGVGQDAADGPPIDAGDAESGDGGHHPPDPHGHDGHDGHGGDGEAAARGEVIVHVAGAVTTPGVVTLPAGARVSDAIEAAGGLLSDADTVRINLARPLQDGEQLLVLRVGEEPPAYPGGAGSGVPDGTGADAGPGGGANGGTGGGPIDLNTASQQQLETLPGIGPAIAGRIVQHREQHGPFRQPGDLRDVSGIGEKRFQDLADLITVG